MANFVGEGGHLLIITRGREQQDPEGQMPWPLTRGDLDDLITSGLAELLFEDYLDSESPPVRRFRGLYQKSVAKS
jgi:hypothetical protein